MYLFMQSVAGPHQQAHSELQSRRNHYLLFQNEANDDLFSSRTTSDFRGRAI